MKNETRAPLAPAFASAIILATVAVPVVGLSQGEQGAHARKTPSPVPSPASSPVPTPTASPTPAYPYLETLPEPPQNLNERYTTCPKEDTPSDKMVWNGEKISYLGYDEVDFSAANWQQKVASRFSNGLLNIVSPKLNVRVNVIDIRNSGGKPKFLYLSNGTQDIPFQSWSSSKFIASLNAIRKIREASRLKYGAKGEFGADSVVAVNSTWGQWAHIGDLITFQHSYEHDSDDNGGVSNSISSWFLELGTKARAGALIHGWLNRPKTEDFTQGYGTSSPVTQTPIFHSVDGTREIALSPIKETSGHKQMSALTLSEALKRVVTDKSLREEKFAKVRFPGVEHSDVETLLYGAPDKTYGGMLKGLGVYLHKALGGVENLNAKTDGKWRIFSKIGYGPSRGGEFVFTAAACLPGFDGGREFVMTLMVNQYPYHDDPAKDRDALDDALMLKLVTDISRALVPGFAPSQAGLE